MKTSDVPDIEVLKIITRDPQTHWPYSNLGTYLSRYPKKIALSKMKQLLKRNLVNGCGCGCRGDWVITDTGVEFLSCCV